MSDKFFLVFIYCSLNEVIFRLARICVVAQNQFHLLGISTNIQNAHGKISTFLHSFLKVHFEFRFSLDSYKTVIIGNGGVNFSLG